MVRPYRVDDGDELWELKQAFERELGESTGGEAKAEVYNGKLDAEYRDEYLAWVTRCVEDSKRSVQVVERSGTLAGYVFILPESLAYIWDAAVLNELYLRPAYRGSGCGDELMDAALEAAREQSLPLNRLVLDVDQNNDRAQAFYERWGFDHWGEMVAREL
ncbi:GNAT family N-acetyltransferase [Halovenus rubra]|uniref:GNAT family N-acetyltransferase n=2 Tax=Halovenus rubra TaxID=869890 RepID=A0ABD5X3R6_9EURY|nr:GNAT family N-acetyltransferase [Halovenus rubra]